MIRMLPSYMLWMCFVRLEQTWQLALLSTTPNMLGRIKANELDFLPGLFMHMDAPKLAPGGFLRNF